MAQKGLFFEYKYDSLHYLLFTNIHSPFPTLLKEYISIPH